MSSKLTKIGINGLGRIGRSLFHQIKEIKSLEIVCLNDTNNNLENISYTLNYDSTYSLRENRYYPRNNNICDKKNKKKIKVFNKKNINDVNWEKEKIDILIDSSGLKLNSKKLKSMTGNFISLITNSDDENIKHLIYGLNEQDFDKKNDKVISGSICDAVAISPILNKIDDSFNLMSGSITTIHPLLNYQNALDARSASWSVPNSTYGHFELGRSFINNIIPKPTSALNAISKACNKNFNEKIISFSYRVPTTIVGSADISLVFNELVTKENFLKCLKSINKYNKDIILFSDEKLVSIDFMKNNYSAIVDLRWLEIKQFNNQTFLKLIIWYDNEWGYSSKLIDLIKSMDLN